MVIDKFLVIYSIDYCICGIVKSQIVMASSCPGTSRSCDAEIQSSPGCIYKNELHTQFNFACLATTFKSKMLCDVVLVAEGLEVFAHKLVLASCSTSFYWKFSKDKKSALSNRIEIENITYETLSAVIEYLYKSEILINEDNVEDILAAADMFVLQDLQVACRKFLEEHLNTRNCLKHRDIAKRFNYVQLVPIIDNFVGLNFASVTNGHEFLQLPHEQVLDLIGSDVLCVREEDVLECVFKWITHDIIVRKGRVYTFLDKIRFLLIPQQYLLERLTKEHWLKSDPRFEIFLGKLFQCYVLGGVAESVPKSKQSLKRCRSSKSTIQTSDLLVVAGFNKNGNLSVEMYDFQQNIWIKWPETLDMKCDYNSRFAIVGSELYVFTGLHMKFSNLNNPTSLKWSEGFPIDSFAYSDWNLACHGNKIFVVSAKKDPRMNSKYFDVSKKAWLIIPPMLEPRYVGWGSFKDSLYAVGGHFSGNIYNSNVYLSNIECFKSSTNSWYSIPNMSIARKEPGVGSLGDKLYVLGGYNNQGASKQVEVFDYSECSWSTVPEMNHARSAPGVIALNSCLYVVGGYNNFGVIDSVEVFDPQSNTWSMFLPPMTTGKKYVALGLIARSEVNILQPSKRTCLGLDQVPYNNFASSFQLH